MSGQIIASRTFTAENQSSFARLSLDRNPMHLDAAFARRTQMGAPVVHGIHTLLWTLDTVLRSFVFDVRNIRVRFHQPLYLNEVAWIRIVRATKPAVSIEVLDDHTVIAAIRLASEPGKLTGSSARGLDLAPQTIADPVDLSFEQMAGRRGAVATAAGDNEDKEITALFPAVSGRIGLAAVRALLATSQVVGMACPGLHSLFAGLDINVDSTSAHARALCYAVSRTDARFRSLQIDVAGSGIAGRIEAFARLPPPAKPGMTAVAARVQNDAFAGQRVLVVGGSRGLGEVTAKIIAAGGGYPVITYRDGQREADSVATDIRQAGRQCEIIRYDALEPAGGQLEGIGAIGCAYYFATT